MLVESGDLEFVCAVSSVGTSYVDWVVGWKFVGVFDEIAQIAHEELEVRHFVFFIEISIDQTHVNCLLNDGFNDTERDDLLYTTVALLIEFFGYFRAILRSGLESKLHESLKSFGDSISKLEVSYKVDKVHGDISIRVREAGVLNQRLMIKMVLKLLHKELIHIEDSVFFELGGAYDKQMVTKIVVEELNVDGGLVLGEFGVGELDTELGADVEFG